MFWNSLVADIARTEGVDRGPRSTEVIAADQDTLLNAVTT